MFFEELGIYKTLRTKGISEKISYCLAKLCCIYDDMKDEDPKCGEEIERNQTQLANFHKIEYILKQFQNFKNGQVVLQGILSRSLNKPLDPEEDKFIIAFFEAIKKLIKYYNRHDDDLTQQLNKAITVTVEYLADWKKVLKEKVSESACVSLRM